MANQTEVQKEDALRFGSVILSIGDDIDSLVNVGCLRDFAPNAKNETTDLLFDNCPVSKKFAKGNRMSFALALAEIDFTTLSKIDAGLVNLTVQAGVLVPAATQVIDGTSKAYQEFLEIEHQNGSGAALVIASVVGSVDPVLVEDVDYELVKNGAGKYGIIMISGGAVSAMAQNFTVTYAYTPNASKTITFNTSGQKSGVYVRMQNTDENGKIMRIDLENATNITPWVIPFVSDNEEDVATLDVEIEGDVVDMYDEQSVS